jgi:large subunit ribosomal protein L9
MAMEVILLERVENLGLMGEIVKVKPGYARNYLLPQRKALRLTEANKAKFEASRAQLEAQNLERRSEAETVSGRMGSLSVVILRQAAESGSLYGSVSARDIGDAVSAAGYKVERRQVLLDTPIKAIGAYPVRVALHPEVIVTVSVNVARSQEEADRAIAAAASMFEKPPEELAGAEQPAAAEAAVEPEAKPKAKKAKATEAETEVDAEAKPKKKGKKAKAEGEE